MSDEEAKQRRMKLTLHVREQAVTAIKTLDLAKLVELFEVKRALSLLSDISEEEGYVNSMQYACGIGRRVERVIVYFIRLAKR